MNWTTPKDLKKQLTRLWDRGELLRDVVTGNVRFPLRLTLKVPDSSDITDRFDSVRAWIAELSSTTPLHLEWQELHHRVQGTQRLPASAWINSVEDALTWLGKRREWDRFSALVSTTRQANSVLLSWLEKRPLQALEMNDEWPRLLAVVGWLMNHPRPSIYLRQVDLPGVHTKFIEAHRSVLAELLDLTLPSDAIDVTKTGISQFAGRYGFLDKPPLIRFRVLDSKLQLLLGPICPDITLDAHSFSRLDMAMKRVFITENETNFLAFPSVPDSIVIFGKGYGWEALSRAHWLRTSSVYYWGDIDTHGFAILDQLRAHFSHVSSFLMDGETLHIHELHWGVEPDQVLYDLTRLDAKERALFDDLRDNRIRKNLRLEQERIGFDWVAARLQKL